MKRSLSTRDPAEAKRKAPGIISGFLRMIEQAEAMYQAEVGGEPVDPKLQVSERIRVIDVDFHQELTQHFHFGLTHFRSK